MGLVFSFAGDGFSVKSFILAGGKSLRFGSDKALAKIKGVSMIERTARLLRECDLEPVVITRRGRNYDVAGCPMIYDQWPDLGPLGGIYSAMTLFKETQKFIFLSCDMPHLRSELVLRLIQKFEEADLAAFFSAGSEEVEPFPGIYRREVLDFVRTNIQREKLSVRSLIHSLPRVRKLRWEGDVACFENMNFSKNLTA